jgi:hypothetical protein
MVSVEACLTDAAGMGGEPLLAAAGRAMPIGLVGVLTGELTIGVGVGVATSRGFAALAVPRRLGQTTTRLRTHL